MSESTVDFTFGGRRTRVAPAVGGPHDGKLARYDWVIETVRIPFVGGYHLVGDKDGERYWQFEGQACVD